MSRAEAPSAFLVSQGGTALSLPDARDEAWRYTPLKALARRALAVGDPDAAVRVLPADTIDATADAARTGARLAVINGALCSERSTLTALPSGLAVASVPRAGAVGPGARDAFDALNRLHAPETLTLAVADGALIAEPLTLDLDAIGAGEDRAWYASIAIGLGRGARMTLIERGVGLDDHAGIGNVALDIALADGAELIHVRIDDEAARATRFDDTRVDVGRNARYTLYARQRGAALARHALTIGLAAPGASATLRGASELDHGRHAANEIAITHAARETRCDIRWRTVVGGRARAGLRGGIAIARGSDASVAALDAKALLLSAEAEVQVQPLLEIDADEVQASHGATVGQLDGGALFYLRARGIGEPEARALLTRAFVDAAFAEVPAGAIAGVLGIELRAR